MQLNAVYIRLIKISKNIFLFIEYQGNIIAFFE